MVLVIFIRFLAVVIVAGCYLVALRFGSCFCTLMLG